MGCSREVCIAQMAQVFSLPSRRQVSHVVITHTPSPRSAREGTSPHGAFKDGNRVASESNPNSSADVTPGWGIGTVACRADTLEPGHTVNSMKDGMGHLNQGATDGILRMALYH